jgi:RNA polymerase sigma-70 factor (ECF subfamily)
MEVVCRRITGNDQDALDACQEALIKAWRAIGRFEGRSKFVAWLCAIATNSAIGVMRKRRPQPIGDDLEVVSLRDPADSVCDRSSVDWALSKLPPQFRAALVLREYADLSYEEIASVLGIPVNTVKSQISRARQALRHLLLEPAE